MLFLISGTIFFAFDILYSPKWIYYCDAVTEAIPGWIVVAVIIDAFSKMHSSDQQQTISHKVIFVQVTANVIYALAFSAFAILFKIFPWVWYVKLFFEFFSLLILTFTLISIV